MGCCGSSSAQPPQKASPQAPATGQTQKSSKPAPPTDAPKTETQPTVGSPTQNGQNSSGVEKADFVVAKPGKQGADPSLVPTGHPRHPSETVRLSDFWNEDRCALVRGDYDVLQEAVLPHFAYHGKQVKVKGRDLDSIKEPRLVEDCPIPSYDTDTNDMKVARELGLDPAKEKHLMYIAQGLARAGPPCGWKCIELLDQKGKMYMTSRHVVQPEHPMQGHYKMLLWEARNGNNPDEMVGSPKGGYSKPTPLVYAEGVRWRLSDGTAIDPNFPDFNSEFQKVWAAEALQPQQLIEREQDLQKILQRFRDAAEASALAFIAKYSHGDRDIVWRCGNLLLSFQNSTKDMKKFGSREAAVKMNQHEMRGVQCVLAAGMRLLCSPLFASVRFLGNRVLVVAMVPISDRTLVLGPENVTEVPDARTYRMDKKAEYLLSIVAEDYRLMSHCTPSGEMVQVGSCLVEAHSVGNSYIVTQSASLLPCIPLLTVDGYKFRGELVLDFRQKHGPSLHSMDEQTIFADLKAFLEERVKNFAKALLHRAKNSDEGDIEEGAGVVTYLHQQGINVRYLGAILEELEKDDDENAHFQAQIIRVEIMARALKFVLREADEEDRMQLLRRLFRDPHSTLRETVQERFNCDIKDEVDPQHILERFCLMTDSEVKYTEMPDGRVASSVDVKLAEPSIKHCGHVFSWSRIYQKARPELLTSLDRHDTSKHVSADGMTDLALPGDLVQNMKNISSLYTEHVAKKALVNISSELLRRPTETCEDLARLLHRHGVNLRFLGELQPFMLRWQSGAGTARTKEGRAMAIEMLQAEMLARTFKSFLEDRLQGKTYTEAVKVGRKAFQELINDPTFLVPRMYRKYGGKLSFDLPSAKLVIGRCVELTGTILLMEDPYTVSEVAFRPKTRVVEIPKHLRVGWMKYDDEYSIEDLISAEEQLLDRLDGRTNTPEALPILAMLSFIYGKWVDRDSSKGGDWHKVIREMLDVCDVNSNEFGYANMIMGEFFVSGDDKAAAEEFFRQAEKVFEKNLGPSLALVQAIRAQADAASTLERSEQLFQRAKEVVKKARLSRQETSNHLTDIDFQYAELLRSSARYGEAAEIYRKVILAYGDQKDLAVEEKAADAKDKLGRTLFYLGKYSDALLSLKEGLKQYQRVCPQHNAIPEMYFTLAQIEKALGNEDSAVSNFKRAAIHYNFSDQTRAMEILKEEMLPILQKRGEESRYYRYKLDLLTGSNAGPEEEARTLVKLANAYNSEGDTRSAIDYYKRAYKTYLGMEGYGESHPTTKECAEQYKALGGREALHRPSHPLVPPIKLGMVTPEDPTRRPESVGRRDSPAGLYARSKATAGSILRKEGVGSMRDYPLVKADEGDSSGSEWD